MCTTRSRTEVTDGREGTGTEGDVFTVLERKQLGTGRKFGMNNSSGKGAGAEETASTPRGQLRPQRSMDALPPRRAAAHIRNTNRHTWSRWVSKNKGFYQFVCHPVTISLCNVSSHGSASVLKQFPFASNPPPVPSWWEQSQVPA